MMLLHGSSLRPLNPVKLTRDALAKCPDKIPARGTSELLFIEEGGFKERLRLNS
jgi:hypothetical protein